MVASHTFRGRSMQEAVRKLKATLGPDAVIVSTRRGQDHRGRYVEITASGTEAEVVETPAELPPARGGARGASAAYARTAGKPQPFAERAAWLARQIQGSRAPEPTAPSAPAPAEPPRQDDTLAALRKEIETLRAAREAEEVAALRREVEALRQQRRAAPELPAPVAEVTPIRQGDDGALTALREELGEVRRAVDALGGRPAVSGLEDAVADLRARLGEIRGLLEQGDTPLVEELQARLVEVGVSASHARELAREAVRQVPDGTADDGDLLAALGHSLATDLACTGDLLPRDGERRVLAFVGPTGVGKTTTIAKVAARAALLEQIPTALVTVDTFRMAAVDQLARYADILECPLYVVKRPEELPQVLAELSDVQLVLVDTTGRNPRAKDQVNALARFFPEGWGGEMLLTVAASTRERDLFATVDAFAELGCAGLVVTKTDETDAVGMPYTLARRASKPIAWTTNGQRVPEDIEQADAARIAAGIVAAAAGRGGVALAS